MTRSTEQPLSTLAVLMRLLGFLWPFAGWVALSVVLGSATVASSIGLMGSAGYIIARAALHPSIAVLEVAIVGVRFFGLLRGVSRYLERLVSHSVNFRLLAQLRFWFYQHLEPLAPARLQDYQSGDLLGRAVADIDTLENFYVRAVAPLLTSAVITVGMTLFVGRFDARLGWVLLGGLLLSGAGIPLLVTRFGRGSGRALVASQAKYGAALVDSVQGMADLLVYGQGGHRAALLRRLSQETGRAQIHLTLAGAAGSALNLLVTNLTLMGVLLVAIPLVSAGLLEGYLLAVITLLVLASFEAANPLVQAGQHLESSLAAARRLFDLVGVEPAVQEPAAPLLAPGSIGLSIRSLTFRYAPDLAPAIEEFNLELPPGKKVAVVGASGAGKTTLINLLLRFWEFQQGSIHLDGQDLRAYASQDIRRCLGVISQSVYLFSATVRENLRLAAPQATEEQMLAALQQAELDRWLAGLPQGLDSWTGEHGLAMSGGERQRLALARILLQDAPLVLLDEPTAHLDASTEAHLLATLNRALRGRSLIFLTHRLAGLEAMDEIMVLQHGRVIERGLQADLLALHGTYASMWALQHGLFDTGTISGEGTSKPKEYRDDLFLLRPVRQP